MGAKYDKFLGKIREADEVSGGVSGVMTVNGKSPNDAGNVTINASNISTGGGITVEESLSSLPTVTDVDLAISSALATYATTASVTTAIDAALATYATTASVTTAIDSALATYATTASVTTAIDSALTDYYTTSQIASLLGDYVTTGGLASALATYATTASVSSTVNDALADYYTGDAVDDLLQGYVLKEDYDNSMEDYSTTVEITAAINSALTPYATTASVNSTVNNALAGYYTSNETTAAITSALTPYAKTAEIAATYLPLAGGNITGDLTVANNPVTALPAGTVAGTLYVGANREFTTIAAALDHILQSSNGLDKEWNILLDPGEYSISGTITGLRLNIAPVSGSYSVNCRIVGWVTFDNCYVTFSNMHIGSNVLSTSAGSVNIDNSSYGVFSGCVFYAGASGNSVAYNRSRGVLDKCTFYAPTTSRTFYALYASWGSCLQISGNLTFIGTAGVTGTRAIYLLNGSVASVTGGVTVSISNCDAGIYCVNGSQYHGGWATHNFTGVTTNSSPADGTVGNDNSYVNV